MVSLDVVFVERSATTHDTRDTHVRLEIVPVTEFCSPVSKNLPRSVRW